MAHEIWISLQWRQMGVCTSHLTSASIVCPTLFAGYQQIITVTSEWARSRLKSVASRLFYSTVCSDADKKTSKLRVTGLCEGNSPVAGEFPTQRAGYAENISSWWNHHGKHQRSTLLAYRVGMNTVTRNAFPHHDVMAWKHFPLHCSSLMSFGVVAC